MKDIKEPYEMESSKMNLFRIFLLLTLLLPTLGLAQEKMQKVDNFLQNVTAKMSAEEQEAFWGEVTRAQQELESMSPEERAQKEREAADMLDSFMGDQSPIKDMFDNSPTAAPAPKPMPKKLELPKEKTYFKPKAKKPIAKKSDTSKHAEVINKIVNAVDSILIKSSSMSQISHNSWNEGKWKNLKKGLGSLKSNLMSIKNNDKMLQDLISNKNDTLLGRLNSLELVITDQARQLKTPDSMGLIVVFEGKPKITDQRQYDLSVKSLVRVANTLDRQVNEQGILDDVLKLTGKHTPKEKRPSLRPQAHKPLEITKKVISKPAASKSTSAKNSKEVSSNIQKFNTVANSAFAELVDSYLKNPSNSNSKRKLQWKLSELDVYLSKITKAHAPASALGQLQNKDVIAKLANSKNASGGIASLAMQLQSGIETLG